MDLSPDISTVTNATVLLLIAEAVASALAITLPAVDTESFAVRGKGSFWAIAATPLLSATPKEAELKAPYGLAASLGRVGAVASAFQTIVACYLVLVFGDWWAPVIVNQVGTETTPWWTLRMSPCRREYSLVQSARVFRGAQCPWHQSACVACRLLFSDLTWHLILVSTQVTIDLILVSLSVTAEATEGAVAMLQIGKIKRGEIAIEGKGDVPKRLQGRAVAWDVEDAQEREATVGDALKENASKVSGTDALGFFRWFG